MLDKENFLAVEPHIHMSFVLGWKPKVADFFVLAHKIGSRDPKRQLSCGMPGNLDHSEVVAIDPYFSLKEIFVQPLGNCLNNQAVMSAKVFFSQRAKRVVRRRNRTIVVVLSSGRRNLALDQPV